MTPRHLRNGFTIVASIYTGLALCCATNPTTISPAQTLALAAGILYGVALTNHDRMT